MNMFFLAARALHVLLGATWLGMAVATSFFLMPAVQELGPDSGKVMMALTRRGFDAFIASVAGLTVLSGLWLYWHFTAGFDPGISSTASGRVFGLGGILGLVAAIVGGSVVSRSARKIAAVARQAATADPGTRSQLMQQLDGLKKRVATGGRVVAVLLIITIVLMALGHYV